MLEVMKRKQIFGVVNCLHSSSLSPIFHSCTSKQPQAPGNQGFFSLMLAIIDQLTTSPRITILRRSKTSGFPSGHHGLDFVATNSEKMTSVVTDILSLSIGEILVTTTHLDTCRRWGSHVRTLSA